MDSIEDSEVPAPPAASAQDKRKTSPSGKKVSSSGSRGNFGRYVGKFFKAIRSTLGLFVMLVLYTVAGAFIFRAIESPNEKEIVRNMIDKRERMVDMLWNLVRTTNQTQEEWRESVHHEVLLYEEVVRKAFKNGVSTNTSDVWNIYGALFFCGTVYTTIGYGNIAPVTRLGRGLCILYAAVGIPFMLVLLSSLGKKFTYALNFSWAAGMRRYYRSELSRKVNQSFKKSYKPSKQRDNENFDSSEYENAPIKVAKTFNVPLSFATIILILYMLLGAMMYSLWEDWSYLDAFYFVFISLSTIGFGDVLPQHPKYFLLASVYIIVGLSLLSMCINVAMELFSKTITETKVRVAKTIDKTKEVVTEVAKRIKDEVEERKKKSQDSVNKSTEIINELLPPKGRPMQPNNSFRSGDSKQQTQLSIQAVARMKLKAMERRHSR